MQREYELLKCQITPKWTSIARSLASALEKNSLAHYELACSKGDSVAKWGTEENKR